ncbi:MAG: thermonuclease family protein [bacterium]
MNRLMLVLMLAILLLPIAARAQEAEVRGTYEGEVTKVKNGDIFDIDGESFRLMGIDAPRPSKCPRVVSCRADEAKKFLEEKILGRTVTYDYDRMQGRRDKRGIRRIYLYLDGELVNATMIEQGNAFADRARDYEKKDLFLGMENLTRRRSMGLWHSCPVECTGSTVCRTKSW